MNGKELKELLKLSIETYIDEKKEYDLKSELYVVGLDIRVTEINRKIACK